MKKKTDTEFQHKFGKMIKGKHSLLLEAFPAPRGRAAFGLSEHATRL
jgi:hypothetical protein